MVRPVETIRREMDSLNQATGALAAEFNRLYTSYLDSLGIALRRQVVMATYHLCTQIYPEGFLALSVGQREKLQRDIRQLGQQANTWLQHLLEPEPPDPTAEGGMSPPATIELSSLGEVTLPGLFPGGQVTAIGLDSIRLSDDAEDSSLDQIPEQAETLGQLTEAEGPASEPDAEPEAEADAEPEADDPGPNDEETMPLPALLKSMVLAALAEEMGESFGERLFTGDAMTPTRLAKQHIFLEQRIRRVLQRTSKQANHLLQAAQVIPNLPEAVLDAASETAVGPTRGRSVPNVLSVLVAMATDMADDMSDHLDDDEELDQEAMDEVMNGAMAEAMDEAMNGAMDEDDGETHEEPSEGMMTHLAAVNLRLSDVEFTDVQASLWRGKLRTALGHLRKLGKQYQKAQREMAIAEAEQAWRAVWYDDTTP
jgi:hypothetical protein